MKKLSASHISLKLLTVLSLSLALGPIYPVFAAPAITATAQTKVLLDKAEKALAQSLWQESIQLSEKAIQLQPQLAEAYLKRGRARANLNQLEAALQDFNKAIQLDPQSSQAYSARAKFYTVSRRFPEAQSDYAQALKRNPKLVDAYTYRGAMYLMWRKPQEALKDLNQALQLEPRNLGALEARAALYFEQLKNPTLALADLNQILALPQLPAFNQARAFNLMGMSQLNLKHYPEAISALEKAIKLNPQAVEVVNNLGLVYEAMGQRDKARQQYEASVKLEPNENALTNLGNLALDAQQLPQALDYYTRAINIQTPMSTNMWIGTKASTYNNRGKVYLQMAQPKEAQKDFEKAIQLDPNSAQGYNLRGLSLAHQKQCQTALADFTQAIAKDPSYLQAYGNRALCYRELQQLDKALADFTFMVNKVPNNEGFLLERSRIYLAMRDAEKGLQDLNKALLLNTEYVPALLIRAELYLALEKFPEVLQDCAKIRKLSPQVVWSYVFAADAYIAQEKFTEALAEYEHVEKLEKNSPFVPTSRGWIYFKKGDLAESEKQLNLALKMQPEYALAHLYMGVLAEKKGNLEGAKSSFEKACQLGEHRGCELRKRLP